MGKFYFAEEAFCAKGFGFVDEAYNEDLAIAVSIMAYWKKSMMEAQ